MKNNKQTTFEEKIEVLRQYVTSSKGAGEIKKAVEIAEEENARLRRVSRVDPLSLLIPTDTIKMK